MKKEVLFIINPISGGKNKDRLKQYIANIIDKNRFNYDICSSQAPGDAEELSKQAALAGKNVIVAVGGDGTINEVAKGILNGSEQTILGIIPMGSGNGLARHLKIPLQVEKALRLINEYPVTIMDSGVLNGEPFFNVAGMGFDARISMLFAKSKKRGIQSYIKAIFQELLTYKGERYRISVDKKEQRLSAFMLCIANATRFGYNAHIAPNANIRDGLLDLIIVKPFPLWALPELVFKMMTNKVQSSRYVEMTQGKHILIRREKENAIHLDGEPKLAGELIEIKVCPQSLRVLSPSGC